MIQENTQCTACSEALDPELVKRLDEMIETFKKSPGGLIPVLQAAQGIFGYLPDAVIKRISLAMKKSYSEVAGVIGFYSFFSTKPRGKHLVRVCLGTACYVRGGQQVLDAVKRKLGVDVGDLTPDKMFSLEVARCFGACGLAPTLSIDEEVFKRVKPARVAEIIDRFYVRETEMQEQGAAAHG